MKKYLSLFICFLVGVGVSTSFFIYKDNAESTKKILEDITRYKKKSESLKNEIAKYTSGLYPSLLKAEKATYDNIIASLEEKRVQLVHKVVFSYPKIDKHFFINEEKLDKIKHEIDTIKNKIEEDKKESALYRPCLMKTLIDTRCAQRQLTLAGLERAFIAFNHNIPLPIIESYDEKQHPKEESPGAVRIPASEDIIQDSEAL